MSAMCCFKERELVCVTGAGGKTSLIIALATPLAERSRVMVTTTTRMGCWEIPKGYAFAVGDRDFITRRAKEQKRGHPPLFAACGVAGEKYLGLSPDYVDYVYVNDLMDIVLVEGDGAKKFPVKGYSEWEPVIPGNTTCHIVVVGAEIFFKVLDEKTVFRPESFFSVSGITPGKVLSAGEIVRVLEHPQVFLKGSPKGEGIRRILVINKIDLLEGAGEDVRKKLQDVEKTLSKYDDLWKVSLKCKG
ncbi:MAG TPA: putative selenium-dependent hydroxylase accessory protein YqeC [Thermovirga lienii]|jgi:probable selenium-dependent hydroxylase accessory protein YqeC|nr:putative selenium-dependent hydroxylase accessory protein YqeC [Thermovirga lienii]